jgi:hypothetical protein
VTFVQGQDVSRAVPFRDNDERRIGETNPQLGVPREDILRGRDIGRQFLSQALAVEHAQRCAQDNRPSVVVVIEGDGTVVAGWEFPLEAEKIA